MHSRFTSWFRTRNRKTMANNNPYEQEGVINDPFDHGGASSSSSTPAAPGQNKSIRSLFTTTSASSSGVQPSPERHKPLYPGSATPPTTSAMMDLERQMDLENPPLVPDCVFRNVNEVDLERGPIDLDSSMTSGKGRSGGRIASALAAAQRALTPPKYNLDYHAQENFPTWREGATPPRSQTGTPIYGGTPRQDDLPPAPPRQSAFRDLAVRKGRQEKDGSEASSHETPVCTPSVTPHGTPRSDMTNKVFSAARHGKHKVVEDCLLQEEGYFDPLNTVDHHGNTLFHIACQNGNKKIGKLAIKYGGDMNKQNNKGNTGLHFLYQFGYSEIAEYFISKGADGNIENDKGYPCYKGFRGDIEPNG
ncbi:unnamed protein product [Amoebophrya sp. A25]|nr:unnamed protein product [Amoebophrya sp. A25]|eukprot:GSA25T00008073001.1